MFAISYEIDNTSLAKQKEIGNLLEGFSFHKIHEGAYITDADNFINLFEAINALKKIDWFRQSVRDIRAFRVENWSDFTQFIKE